MAFGDKEWRTSDVYKKAAERGLLHHCRFVRSAGAISEGLLHPGEFDTIVQCIFDEINVRAASGIPFIDDV